MEKKELGFSGFLSSGRGRLYKELVELYILSTHIYNGLGRQLTRNTFKAIVRRLRLDREGVIVFEATVKCLSRMF